MRKELTREELHDIFEYKEGLLFWKKRLSIRISVGKIAGNLRISQHGNRRVVGLYGKDYLCSRLIFLYHHGYLPKVVDHKDRNPANDNIENLRPATCSQNSGNSTSRKNSSSQYLGVYFFKRDKNWCSQITKNGKVKCLGYFVTEEEAALAYNKAAIEIHGEFASINKVELI